MTAHSTLRAAAHAYASVAMALLDPHRSESESIVSDRQEWVRAEDGCFRLQPQKIEWWRGANVPIRRALHARPEYSALIAAISSDERSSVLLNGCVGTSRIWTLMGEGAVIDRLIWALARHSSAGVVDDKVFDEEFSRWDSDLHAEHVVHVGLVPLLGFSTSNHDIQLDDGVAICRLADDEIGRLLSLGFQLSEAPPSPYRPLARIKHVHGLRIHRRTPRRIARETWKLDSSFDPASDMNDLAEDVLVALRLFKAQRVGSFGYAIFYELWPLDGSTMFGNLKDFPTLMGQPGFAYDMDDDESARFPAFFRACQSARKNRSVGLAMRRFAYAADRSREEDQVLDMMIAAEALFLGGADRGELAYRLALRGAFFISTDAASRAAIHTFLKTAYAVRSAVAHGSIPDTKKLRTVDGSPCKNLQDFAVELNRVMRSALHRAIDHVSQHKGYLDDSEWNALILGVSKHGSPTQ
jgi:hypothetical protein